MRALLILAFCLAPLASSAAEEGAPVIGGHVTLYGWLTSAEIDSAVPLPNGGTLETGISAGLDDIFDVLDFAAFANAELRNGRFGLIGDLIYTKLSADRTGPRGAGIDADVKTLVGLAALAWRPWQGERAFVDVLGGARILATEVRLRRSGRSTTREASTSGTLVDPLFGARLGYAATDSIALRATADVGGFGLGTQLSWQVYAGASYAFSDNVLGELGFRYLSINIEDDGAETRLQLHGPVLGVTYSF